MSQFDRQQKQKQEKEKEEYISFLKDSFKKLFKFQLDQGIVAVPMLVENNHPFQGHHLTAEITFRKMNPEDKEVLEKQLAQPSDLIVS